MLSEVGMEAVNIAIGNRSTMSNIPYNVPLTGTDLSHKSAPWWTRPSAFRGASWNRYTYGRTDARWEALLVQWKNLTSTRWIGST